MRLPSRWVRLAIAAVALFVLLAAPVSAQDVIANDDNTEADLFWLRTITWQAQRKHGGGMGVPLASYLQAFT